MIFVEPEGLDKSTSLCKAQNLTLDDNDNDTTEEICYDLDSIDVDEEIVIVNNKLINVLQFVFILIFIKYTDQPSILFNLSVIFAALIKGTSFDTNLIVEMIMYVIIYCIIKSMDEMVFMLTVGYYLGYKL